MAHKFHHIAPDPPSLLHCVFNGGEVVVHNDDVGRFLGHVAPAFPHGDAHVRRAEGGGVIYTIAWGRDGGRKRERARGRETKISDQ